MNETGGRLRAVLQAVALLLCVQPTALIAESSEERLHRLEKEIEELRQMLDKQQQAAPAPAQPAAVAAPEPVAAPAPAVAPEPGGVYVRYYISDDAFTEQPPVAATPAVQGRFTEPDTLSFDPAAYDVPDAGLFSHYRDPASYRYVGVQVDADLSVREAGVYEFVLYPKPVREGGTSVSTRMTAWLWIDGAMVVELTDQAGWQTQRGQVRLEPGAHRVRIWAMAASDGFGPSPTGSRLQLAFKAPGDASPHPLRGLRPANP